MFIRLSTLILSFALWLPSVAFSNERVGAPYSFAGPEVLKTDWSTRAVRLADLNDDGRTDLVLINNDAARLEMFFQRDPDAPREEKRERLARNRWDPVLEDARFDEETLTVGFPMFDLVAEDLNGDGRIDLAYTARDVPLTLRCQDAEGAWKDVKEFDRFEALGWISTLECADLDRDGDNELVVLAADALRVFHPDANGDPGEPEVYHLTGENPFNLMLEDVTGDGLLDVLYISTDGKQALTVREQLAETAFGPERRFKLDRPVRNIRAMPSLGGESPRFVAISSRSGGLELIGVDARPDADSAGRLDGVQPEIYPVARSGRGTPVYAFGDLDGNGGTDVLVADPAAAEVIFYPGLDRGFGAPRTFPTFAKVNSLVVGQFGPDGERSLAVVSAEEELLGLSRLDEAGRLSFPQQIDLDGPPLACCAFDADGDGTDELAIVMGGDGGAKVVLMGRKASGGDSGAGWTELGRFSLEGVRRMPEALRVVKIFDGNRPGLMVFVPREAPVLLSADAEAPFALKSRAVTSSLRESFLKDVEPPQISVFDVNRDGVNELVVGKEGFARALAYGDDALEMVDQFNTRRSEDQVYAAIPIASDGELSELMFYVPNAGELQFLRRGEDGVFRFAALNPAGKINIVDWSYTSAEGGSPEVVLAGEDRFWRLAETAEPWQLDEMGSFETKLEDVGFNHVEGVDLDRDGSLEVIAVDGTEHVVEILDVSEDAWASLMYWEIFEQDMHYQGRTGANVEPREVLSGDLNGDGLNDFLFLVHDRILIYPQESKE